MSKRTRDKTTSAVEASSKHAKPVSIFDLSQHVRNNTIGIEQVTPASWFQSFQGQEPARELLFAKLSVPDALLKAIDDIHIKDTLYEEYLKWAPSKQNPAVGIFKKRDEIDSSCRFIIFKIEIQENGTRHFSIRQNYEASFMNDAQKSQEYGSVDGLWQSNLFFYDANINTHATLISHLIALINQQLDLFGNDFTYPLMVAFEYYENREQPLDGERSTLHQDSRIYNKGTSKQFINIFIKNGILFVGNFITRGTEMSPVGGNNVFSLPVTAGNLLIWKDEAFYHETPVLTAPNVVRISPKPTFVYEGPLKNKKKITTVRLQPIYTDDMSELTSQQLIKHSTGELPLYKRNFLRITFYKEGDTTNLDTNWVEGDWMPYNPVVPTYDPFVLDTISIPIPSLQDRIFGRTCNRELESVTRDPRFLKYTAGGSKIKNKTRKKNKTRRKINKCKKCKNYKKTKNKRVKYGGDDRACSLNFNRDFIIYGTPDLKIPLQITY